MTALHRVKAYFGMVPADELDAYDGYGDRQDGRYDDRYTDRYTDSRHESRYDDRHDGRGRARFDEHHDERHDRFSRPEPRRDDRDEHDRDDRDGRAAPRRHAESGDAEAHRPRTPRPRDPEHTENRQEESEAVDATPRTPRGRGWAHNTGPNHTSVRPGPSVGGARSVPSLSPVPSSGSTPAGRSSSALDTPRSRAADASATTAAIEPPAPSEITSLQPTSYNEARVIGERYRDGIPVIMNLSEMDDVAAKRLVDFAAGLAFALRGSIEKVTNRVFLLSPPNVEVSAADRRKLAETGYSASS